MITTTLLSCSFFSRHRWALFIRKKLHGLPAYGTVLFLILCSVCVLLFVYSSVSSSGSRISKNRPPINPKYADFTVVTFGSQAVYDNVENVIGSVHYWAPGIPVVVYDIGLSLEQRSKLACIEGIEVVSFNFTSYPMHVRGLHTYSWKPILTRDAAFKYPKTLFLDAGVEVRGPLDFVFDAINTVGYFFVETTTKYDDMGEMVHQGMVKQTGVPRSVIEGRQMCYGGVYGYRNDFDAATLVADYAARCAMVADCIDPPGAGHDNHRFDQSASSVYIRKHALFCHDEERFREDKPLKLNWDPTVHSEIMFFFRRWRYPKPYIPFVKRIPGCVPPKVVGGDKVLDLGLVETTGHKRHQSNHPLVVCLHENNHDRSKCAREIAASQIAPQSSTKITLYRANLVGFLFAVLVLFWSLLNSWVVPFVTLLLILRLIFRSRQYPDIKALYRNSRRFRVGVWAVVGLLLWWMVISRRHFAWYWHRSCSLDSEGAWKIAIAKWHTNADGLLVPNTRPHASLDCATTTDSPSTFVATPFLTQNPKEVEAGLGNKWFLFYEMKSAKSRTLFWNGRTEIAYSYSIDDGYTWTYGGVALKEPYHLAYPNVFWVDGKPFMVPETKTTDAVLLYTTAAFPTNWHVYREILVGKPFVNPSIFTHGGRWYLLVSVFGNPSDDLHLYHSDNLFGPWTEHPQSPVVRNNAHYSKSAGVPFVDSNGRLLRFAQDSAAPQGAAIHVFEIIEVTATTYRERLIVSDLLKGSDDNGPWIPSTVNHLSIQRMRDGNILAVMDTL